jgi:general secretion pathway protein A
MKEIPSTIAADPWDAQPGDAGRTLAFYGLREQPFGVTPNYRRVYPSLTHRKALSAIASAVQSDMGFSLLIAQPGMGKTTLLFKLMIELCDSALFAFVFQTQCNSREFLRALLTDLKLTPSDDLAFMHEQLKELLVREAGRRRVVIIVDEAHNLEPNVLESLRLLSDFETAERKLLHIVLSAQPQIADKLASPELIQVQQRIQIVARLLPLSAAETAGYITYRLHEAGYTGGPLFTQAAFRRIAGSALGIPRNINRICFHALSAGSALGEARIDEAIVNQVLEDFDFASLRKSCSGGMGEHGAMEELLHSADDFHWDSDPAGATVAPVGEKLVEPLAAHAYTEPAHAEPPLPLCPAEAERIASRAPEGVGAVDLQSGWTQEILEQIEPIEQIEAVEQLEPGEQLEPSERIDPRSQTEVEEEPAEEETEPATAKDGERATELQEAADELPYLTWAADKSSEREAVFEAVPASRQRGLRIAAAVLVPALWVGSQCVPAARQWFGAEIVPHAQKVAELVRVGAERLRTELRLAQPRTMAAETRSQAPSPVGAPPSQLQPGSVPTAQPSPVPPQETQTINPPEPMRGPVRPRTRSLGTDRRNTEPVAVKAGGEVLFTELPRPAQPAAMMGQYQAARLVHQVRLEYPASALRAGAEGEVVLRAEIVFDGHVARVRPVSVSNQGSSKPRPDNGDIAPLIKAATNAVSRWRYEPTRVDGRPVGTTAQIHVNFRLREPALVSGK